jgi:hypothetical protein
MKPTKWPPAYLSKQVPIVINTDIDAVTITANLNSPSDGGAR